MNAEMIWTLMFRVNDVRAVQGRLALAEKLLARPLAIGPCEPYWKIPALWTCAAQTPLRGAGGAEQVLDCLMQAQCLATGWSVRGLDIGSGGELLGFGGVFAIGGGSTTHLSGLEWASFSVSCASVPS